MRQYFNYEREPINETLCIDIKSFYASVECVERQLDPLETMLVVMSNADKGGGLALATSPKAKARLGITNVTRRFEMPDHPDLLIVPPRMNLYIEKNLIINNIFRQYIADEDLLIYSIDESFASIQASKKLFNMTAYDFAKQFQQEVFTKTGLHCAIGIGDNMLLSKLALDNAAKKNQDMTAHWHYQDVPTTVWKIQELTDFWGIGSRMKRRLQKLGIETIYDLAHYDFFKMKDALGVIGQQLVAHAWGIDRTDIAENYLPLEKSIGNSQVLMKDYTDRGELKIVIREIAEQVSTRLRNKQVKTECVRLSIGYSRHTDYRGFSRQMTIAETNHSKTIVRCCLSLFQQYDIQHYAARNISISCTKLKSDYATQLSLFEQPEKILSDKKLDQTIDEIRRRYGFASILQASSLMEGATALARKNLIGGHAGGMDGL